MAVARTRSRVLVAVLSAAVAACSSRRANRVTVRNSSGREFTSVSLTVKPYGGGNVVASEAGRLDPGASLTLPHPMCDLSVELTCSLGGTVCRHREEYLDFWWGEGWILEVLPAGTVASRPSAGPAE